MLIYWFFLRSFSVDSVVCYVSAQRLGQEEQPDLNDVVFALQEGAGPTFSFFARAHGFPGAYEDWTLALVLDTPSRSRPSTSASTSNSQGPPCPPNAQLVPYNICAKSVPTEHLNICLP